MKAIFKDAMGRWITTGLFKEISQTQTYVLWSLDEARKLYIECEDPTGYEFANKYLHSWKHWLALKNSTMAHIIAEWEDELEVKLRSKAVKRIASLAKGDKGYQAAKYIAEGGWKPKEVGRPTREKVNKEARIRSRMYDEFRSDIPKLDS